MNWVWGLSTVTLHGFYESSGQSNNIKLFEKPLKNKPNVHKKEKI